MDLTRLVSRMNIHGPQMGIVVPGGLPEITTQDVYAAMGMGNLDQRACAIALAVYEDTPDAILAARHVAHRRVLELFDEKKWNAGKCFHARVKKWVREEIIQPEEFCAVKTVQIIQFKWSLARLAISELITTHCSVCHGTGTVDYKTCAGCKGSGKRALSDLYKYSHLNISKDAWETWQEKYNEISEEFQAWLLEWEIHILKHVGS